MKTKQHQPSLTEQSFLEDLSKRKLLLGLSALLGSGVAASLTTGDAIPVALAYSPNKSDKITAGKLFSKQQMHTLKSICQTIIPATDTLGAGDVDTHGFIDNQAFYCFDSKSQRTINDVITAINEIAKDTHKSNFYELTTTTMYDSLVKIDNDYSSDIHEAFRFLKSLVVFGYYTSEVGASKELKYLAFPGGFKGSVAYDSIGSSFGSYAYY